MSITVTCENDAPVADDETFDGNNAARGNTTLVVDDPSDGAPSAFAPQEDRSPATSWPVTPMSTVPGP